MTAPHAPARLRTEFLVNPQAVAETQPRLSWEVQDDRPGAVQSAYQVQVAATAEALAAERDLLWDSGQVAGDQSIHVRFGGEPLAAWSQCVWRVRTWDAAGEASAWSAPANWGTGPLTEADWAGDWIGAPPRAEDTTAPSPYLRREFSAKPGLRSARLAATARGLYECWINGRRVGEDYFTPGWTEYGYRIPYQVYDVTHLLQDGANAIGAVLGDGWYAGYLAWKDNRSTWGRDIALRATLVLTYADGSVETIGSDADWTCSEGPIRASDLYNGEAYDARLENPAWATVGATGDWQPVHTYPGDDIPLVPKTTQDVRVTEELAAHEMTEPTPGTYIYDLRQNMVGWARVSLSAPAGTVVTLRFGEMLQDDGQLYTENLRSAKCTDTYTCRGDAEEVYEPTFTFHGFRYVEITGLDAAPALDAVTGVVLHSDTPRTGSFACSHDMVNQLQSNITWGQRGNFLEVPTDCPQRDERLGWTGDAQVFVRTAAWNMDVSAFFTKWAQDMEDSQTKLGDGRFPHVSPNILGEGGAACAWADAGVICPWTMYLCYGDTGILDRHFDSMAAWVDFCEREAVDLIRPESGFGDWLAVDAPNPGFALTLKALIGTAYFARCAELVAKAADLTGRADKAAHYRDLHARIKTRWQEEFVTPAGRVMNHTQTAYLLALGFDLMPEHLRETAAKHLVADIEKRGDHLSTGFVGTPFLAPVLSRVGRTDVAYRLLLQDTYPGWFYSIHQGATTMWERWNSYTKDKGFGPVSMNSFNHYAYGAIGEWMYNTVAGIDLDESEPAYKHIVFRPEPGADLTWAKGDLHSMYGPVASHWTLADGTFTLQVTIPANAHATVRLPVSSTAGVTLDGAAADATVVDGRAQLPLPAGSYTITCPYTAI